MSTHMTTHSYGAKSTHDENLFAQAYPEHEPPDLSLFELVAEHYGYNLNDPSEEAEAESLYEHIMSRDD